MRDYSPDMFGHLLLFYLGMYAIVIQVHPCMRQGCLYFKGLWHKLDRHQLGRVIPQFYGGYTCGNVLLIAVL